jgi:acyl dehydratase
VESPFGATIAHGYLTLSLIPYLMGNVDPEMPRFPGMRMSVNYGLNRVRFPHPVVVGARIRARVTPIGADLIGDDALQVVTRVTVEIENVAKPACVAETISRVYF